MTIKTKSVAAAINSVGPDDAFPGEFEVILSTPALDRDGDRLKSDDWVLPLPAKIQFNTDHSMLVENTVGSGVPTINGDGNLVVRGHYASTEHAQNTRKLVYDPATGHSHIDSVSVTYRELKSGKRELINGAFVVIPSNPEAKVLASKAMGGTDQDESCVAPMTWLKSYLAGDVVSLDGKSLSDMALMLICAGGITHKDSAGLVDVGNGVFAPDALVQAVHDAANSLGAVCVSAAEAGAAAEPAWSFLKSTDGTYNAMQVTIGGKVYTKQIPPELLEVKGDSPTPTVSDPPEEGRSESDADLVKLKARAFALGNHTK